MFWCCFLIVELRRKIRITGFGLADTLAMQVTVCPLTTGSHSPQWTGTTTRRPSAAPVHRPMEAAGGSIGRRLGVSLCPTNWTVKYTLSSFPAWTDLLNQLKRASYWHIDMSRDAAIREKWHTNIYIPAASRRTSMGNTSLWMETTATIEESSGSCG